MSDKPYAVVEKQGGKIICCGKRPVLVQYTSMETIADVLNDEIVPVIEALEEKSLENMQLNERIAELEAALTVAWQYTPTQLLPKELFESFQGGVMDGDSTSELIKAFLAKKAGGNG